MNPQKQTKAYSEKYPQSVRDLPKQFSIDASPQKRQSVQLKSKKSSEKPSKTIVSQQTNKNSIGGNRINKRQGKSIEEESISAITKDNFDIMDVKLNITDIKQLEVKYCLRCIDGIFKNRSLYITTHKEGEIIGGGDAKQYGLTLQIDGVGLQKKHCKLKFSGVKKFYVKDYETKSGTWVNIGNNGVKIKHGDVFLIGPFNARFELSEPIDQIEQLCIINSCNQLCDRLKYNSITSLPILYSEQYNNFKNYPFSTAQIKKLKQISMESKNWFDENDDYKRIQLHLLNQELDLFGFTVEIGWDKFYFPQEINRLLQHNAGITEEDKLRKQEQSIAFVSKGRLFPPNKKSKTAGNKVFTKIQSQKNHQLFLHDQIKIGDLLFELTRFNYGAGENIGFRETMEDCFIVEEDIGGSQWKLISLFAVFDGYGGTECVTYIKNNLVKKIRGWTSMLDEAGDLNQMLKLLMFKTFYEIDYEFYQQWPQLSMSCGATALILLIIDSKAYVFNLGDNKGIIRRSDHLYQLSIDHIPSRIDEKNRIQQQGGYIQYNRLMGKCTLSRAFGQFQYKNVEDYERNMKGKLKSFISCQPESICFDLNPETDDFIFLSTDGLVNALGMKTVINYIADKAMLLDTDENPYKIVNSLMQNSKIVNTQDCDNMAVIIIFISKGKIGGKSAW